MGDSFEKSVGKLCGLCKLPEYSRVVKVPVLTKCCAFFRKRGILDGERGHLLAERSSNDG